MNVYISHLLEDKDLIDLLNNYDVGLETIDFSIGYYLDQKEQTLLSYEKRMGEILNKVSISMHGPFLDLNPASYDPKIRQITLERFEETYWAAKKLKAERIIYHTCMLPNIYYPESWTENSISFWKEFLENKDDRIKIHLENVYDLNYVSIDKVMRAVSHPAFSVCLDIGHANAYSEQTVTEWINGLKDYIGHVHIHNNDGRKDLHSALNDGTIPMAEILSKLEKDCPLAGWTIENDSLKTCMESLQYLSFWKGNGSHSVVLVKQ